MSQQMFEKFKDLVTRLADTDGTIAEEHAADILHTELAQEVLESVVGGQGCLGEKVRNSNTTPSTNYNPSRNGGLYGPFGYTTR